MITRRSLIDELEEKIKRLCETTWDGRVNLADVREWVSQFKTNVNLEEDEQLHALFMLSHFIFFGQNELRQLLKSLFDNLYRSPIIYQIRRSNNRTTDINFLRSQFKSELDKTRFLGVGNPSESGAHLLYFFRQENRLPKNLFINSHEIFKRDTSTTGNTQVIRDQDVEHYVFIDDLCGSGTQAKQYSVDLVTPLKLQKSSVKVYYLVLFGTTKGLDAIRSLKCFDKVDAVFELDETFQSLETTSRVFSHSRPPFVREKVRQTFQKYGSALWPTHPLGYKNGQLLIGFSHNTPDNTFPVIWCDESFGCNWMPIFRRYNKDYGW